MAYNVLPLHCGGLETTSLATGMLFIDLYAVSNCSSPRHYAKVLLCTVNFFGINKKNLRKLRASKAYFLNCHNLITTYSGQQNLLRVPYS